MSITMWIRSPRARLPMRMLGPLLMLLFTYMILSKVTFPTIPTTNTSSETTVLTYLKASLIPADSRHMGGCCGFGPAASAELEFCFSRVKTPGEAVSEGSVPGTRSEGWSLASPPTRTFPKQRARTTTAHIVDHILKKDLRCLFSRHWVEKRESENN